MTHTRKICLDDEYLRKYEEVKASLPQRGFSDWVRSKIDEELAWIESKQLDDTEALFRVAGGSDRPLMYIDRHGSVYSKHTGEIQKVDVRKDLALVFTYVIMELAGCDMTEIINKIKEYEEG